MPKALISGYGIWACYIHSKIGQQATLWPVKPEYFNFLSRSLKHHHEAPENAGRLQNCPAYIRNTYPRARDRISLRQLPHVFKGPLAPNLSFFLSFGFSSLAYQLYEYSPPLRACHDSSWLRRWQLFLMSRTHSIEVWVTHEMGDSLYNWQFLNTRI